MKWRGISEDVQMLERLERCCHCSRCRFLASAARAQGNELFKSGKLMEACPVYGEGLEIHPSNPVILCNRAGCSSKLYQWEQSVEDYNEALKIQPKYMKALLLCAASNGKLERWAESVRDYEVLRKKLPGDTEVAEALLHAQVALKTSRGEEIANLNFGGAVEDVNGLEQFQETINLPGSLTATSIQIQEEICHVISLRYMVVSSLGPCKL